MVPTFFFYLGFKNLFEILKMIFEKVDKKTRIFGCHDVIKKSQKKSQDLLQDLKSKIKNA